MHLLNYNTLHLLTNLHTLCIYSTTTHFIYSLIHIHYAFTQLQHTSSTHYSTYTMHLPNYNTLHLLTNLHTLCIHSTTTHFFYSLIIIHYAFTQIKHTSSTPSSTYSMHLLNYNTLHLLPNLHTLCIYSTTTHFIYSLICIHYAFTQLQHTSSTH